MTETVFSSFQSGIWLSIWSYIFKCSGSAPDSWARKREGRPLEAACLFPASSYSQSWIKALLQSMSSVGRSASPIYHTKTSSLSTCVACVSPSLSGLWTPALIWWTWTTFSSHCSAPPRTQQTHLAVPAGKAASFINNRRGKQNSLLPFVVFQTWHFSSSILGISWPVTPGGRGSWILTGLGKSTMESWER